MPPRRITQPLWTLPCWSNGPQLVRLTPGRVAVPWPRTWDGQVLMAATTLPTLTKGTVSRRLPSVQSSRVATSLWLLPFGLPLEAGRTPLQEFPIPTQCSPSRIRHMHEAPTVVALWVMSSVPTQLPPPTITGSNTPLITPPLSLGTLIPVSVGGSKSVAESSGPVMHLSFPRATSGKTQRHLSL